MYRLKIPGSILKKLKYIILAAVVLVSCDRTRNDKGYEYFPDMTHGRDFKTYSENPAMEDGRTMRKPVEGTIPRHMQPYPYSADFEGRDLAGKNLRNPLEFNVENLTEGKRLYDIFCAQCHGTEGDGQGWLFTSGKYIIPPTNLLEDRILDQPSGETYHVISAGWGVMGEHGSLLLPEQRWQIVAFIEEIIQKK